MTSYDLGMGVGLFGELVVTHSIDKRRLSPQYLHRVFVGRVPTAHTLSRTFALALLRDIAEPPAFVMDSLKQILRICLVDLGHLPKRRAEKRNGVRLIFAFFKCSEKSRFSESERAVTPVHFYDRQYIRSLLGNLHP